MRKMYMRAPLPFMGQKRRFAKEFIKLLEQYPDNTVFVDLFGGSGLLSHITKCRKPNATVVYNDFDNYRQRLANIPRTNALLADLRAITRDIPWHKPITGTARERVFERLMQEERSGFVDFTTVSPSILFSMKYKLSIDALKKEALYNDVRKNDYPLCPDYLDGLTVTSCDYKELFKRYKDAPNVVFLVDPPYLSTEVGTYNMYWKLADYLDVLTVLQGHSFVYFTSNKSSIIELCDWIGRNKLSDNPFEGCQKVTFNAHMSFNSSYTDMMLYKQAGSNNPDAA